MSIQIKPLVCPQCGAGKCSKLPGMPNLYACQNCGAEFVLSDSNAPKQMRVVHSLDEGQFESLKRFKGQMAVVAGMLLLVLLGLMLWPQLLRIFEAARPVLPNYGRLVEITLYQAQGKQYNVVRVMESGDENRDVFQILVNSLDSGKKLAEPQRLEFQRTTLSRKPQLMHFSDGNVYLVINSQRFLKLDQGSAQFVDLNDQLVNRYPRQLSVGISGIERAGDEYRDALVVTSNSGERFYVYWLTGEINVYGDNYSHFRARDFASYPQTVKRYGFAKAPLPVADISFPSLLVSYQQRVKDGEYQNVPGITLQSTDKPLGSTRAEALLELSPQWSVNAADLKKIGVQQLTLVPPVERRFRGDVLAQNASRVLIAFNTTPVTDQGRVLQLLNVADGQVVWSRTVEQLPQITRKGTYLSADALADGFFIRSDNSTPSLLIDNQGAIVHDFSARRD